MIRFSDPTSTRDVVESYDFVSSNSIYHLVPDGTSALVIGPCMLKDHVKNQTHILQNCNLISLSRSYKTIHPISEICIIKLKPFYSFIESLESFRLAIKSVDYSYSVENLSVLERLVGNHIARQSNLSNLVNMVLFSKGDISIDSICKEFGISRQALNKGYANKLGIGFKQLASIWKMNAFISGYCSSSSLVQASLDAGYFDQAHCIKNFKFFFGSTPKAFFESNQPDFITIPDTIDKRFNGFFDP